MTQAPMRRLIERRPSRAPLIGLGVAVLVAGGLAFVPPMAVPAPAGGTSSARVSHVCPALESGVTIGVAGAEVYRAPLSAPQGGDPVASGTVFTSTEPTRLAAPADQTFSGTVVGASGPGVDQGLSMASCTTPRSTQWLTAVRSNSGARADLQLMNLDATPADVNVTVYGHDGALSAAGGRGIAVLGRSTVSVPLGPLADQADPVTVEVQSSSGRVAAYVRERDFSGVKPLGANWIPAVSEPEANTVIPSVPGGDGDRSLVIGNPGDRTAQVQVLALGANGAFTPVGFESLDIPAGTTRVFDLQAALKGQSVALSVTSTRPIVTAVRAKTASSWAVSGSARGVAGGVGATLALPKGAKPLLTLVNPADHVVHVQARIENSDGKVLAVKTIELPASATAVVDPGATASALVWVTSDDPGTRAAVTTTATIDKIAGLGVVNLEGADATAAGAVAMSPDPRLGS